MFMCIICMRKAPSLSSLKWEHRQLLESIVGPIIDMTDIKGCDLHYCEHCEELMQSVQDFRKSALNGVREFKYVLSKLDKATIEQAAGSKLRQMLTLDPITITEKPADEIQAKEEFEPDPEIVHSDEITIDIELEPVKTEQDPLNAPDCIDSKNFPRIQTSFTSGSTESTGSIDSGFSEGMKMNSFDSVDCKKNKIPLNKKPIESTGLIAGIQTINNGHTSMAIGKNKSPFMIGSTESTGLARFSIGMKTMNNSAYSMKSDNNKTPFLYGATGSTRFGVKKKKMNTITDSMHIEKNQTPHMVGSPGFNGSTRFSSGIKTMNKKYINILRKPSASNNTCQLYIREPKSTQIKNEIGANSIIPIQTTKITPCGIKVFSVRCEETANLDVNAISTKTTTNKQKDKTEQAGNQASSIECEIVPIHQGKKTQNQIIAQESAEMASEETYSDSTHQANKTETIIIQDSDSAQKFVPNTREQIQLYTQFKKNINDPKVKKRRKPAVVKEYPCPYCAKILKGPNYKRHIKRFHYKLQPSPCKECGKVFRNKTVLETHMKHHELKAKPKTIDDAKPELFCVECSLQLYSRSAFNKHMMTLKHTPKEKYTVECEICKLKFMDKSGLKQHFDVVHLNKRKHKCDQCDKAFGKAFRLRQHIAIDHEKQAKPRPHVCHLCGKSFTSLKHCREHLLAHEGIRPFQCPLCPATFTYSAALFTHNKFKHLKVKTTCKKVCEKAKVAQHLESIEGVKEIEEVDKDDGAGAEEMKEIGELDDKDDVGAESETFKETEDLEGERQKASEDDTGSIEMLEEWDEDYASEEDSMDIE